MAIMHTGDRSNCLGALELLLGKIGSRRQCSKADRRSVELLQVALVNFESWKTVDLAACRCATWRWVSSTVSTLGISEVPVAEMMCRLAVPLRFGIQSACRVRARRTCNELPGNPTGLVLSQLAALASCAGTKQPGGG